MQATQYARSGQTSHATPYGSPAVAAPGWYRSGSGASWWWDGARWHQPAAPAPRRPSSVVAIGRATRVGLGLAGVLGGAAVGLALQGRRIVQDLGEGAPVSLPEVERLVDRMNAVGVATGLVTLGLAACFIVWLWRAQANLRAWGVRTRLPIGWTVGAWFVPLAQVVLPWLVVDDVARGSAEAAGARPGPLRALVAAWWVTFLGSMVLPFAASGMVGDASDAGDVEAALGVVAAGAVLRVLAACLGAAVVARVVAAQRSRGAR